MTWIKFEFGVATACIAWLVYISKFWEEIPLMFRLTKRGSKYAWRFVIDADFFPQTQVQNDDGVVVQFEGRHK